MNGTPKTEPSQAVFKVVERRPGPPAPYLSAGKEQAQDAHAYWKELERLGKRAGVIISLLSLSGFLFAAGSKVQHVLDDLAALHQQVEAHEERLQRNEADDSEQDEAIGYIRGRLEHDNEREAPPRTPRRDTSSHEQRQEAKPKRDAQRDTSHTSLPSVEMQALPLGDKLYATILYDYRQALRLHPNLAGQITVICRADRSGYLLASQAIASTPELAVLAERLAAKIQRWKFPEQVTGLERGSFQQTYFLSPQGF